MPQTANNRLEPTNTQPTARAVDGSEAGHADSATAEASLFDLQLPTAALALLFGACARSPDALDWLTSDPDRLVVPLLPLVYHPLTSMRRAVARLLAVAVFGPEARKWGGFARAAAATAGAATAAVGGWGLVPPGGGAVMLPAAFVDSHLFPFRLAPVAVSPAAAAQDMGVNSALGGAAADGAPVATTVASRRLVAQQRLLCGANGDPAAAARLLDAPQPPGSDIPQPLLHATAATLAALDAPRLAAAALSAVAAAQSHAACVRALRGLQKLASSGPGLAAALAAPWGEALGRLLGAAPATDDDQRLWLELLPLVERLLVGGACQQVGACWVCWAFLSVLTCFPPSHRIVITTLPSQLQSPPTGPVHAPGPRPPPIRPALVTHPRRLRRRRTPAPGGGRGGSSRG
jgi:hypothetical protein